MSTRVLKSEWYGLVDVPRKNWVNGFTRSEMRCDLHPNRYVERFMQTADHRAIALCDQCCEELRKIQSSPLPPSPPATFDEVNQ